MAKRKRPEDKHSPTHNHLRADLPAFLAWAEKVGYKPNPGQMDVHRRLLDRTRIGDGDRGVGKSTAIAAELAFQVTEFRLLSPGSAALVVCGDQQRCLLMAERVKGFLDRSGVEYEVLTRDRIGIANGGTVRFASLGDLSHGGAIGLPRQDLICFDEIVEDSEAVRAIAPLAANRFLSLISAQEATNGKAEATV